MDLEQVLKGGEEGEGQIKGRREEGGDERDVRRGERAGCQDLLLLVISALGGGGAGGLCSRPGVYCSILLPLLQPPKL